MEDWSVYGLGIGSFVVFLVLWCLAMFGLFCLCRPLLKNPHKQGDQTDLNNPQDEKKHEGKI